VRVAGRHSIKAITASSVARICEAAGHRAYTAMVGTHRGGTNLTGAGVTVAIIELVLIPPHPAQCNQCWGLVSISLNEGSSLMKCTPLRFRGWGALSPIHHQSS